MEDEPRNPRDVWDRRCWRIESHDGFNTTISSPRFVFHSFNLLDTPPFSEVALIDDPEVSDKELELIGQEEVVARVFLGEIRRLDEYTSEIWKSQLARLAEVPSE